MNKMKIISWNCCLPPWSLTRSRRLPFIASTILKEKPDVICLQEVFFKNDAKYLVKKFAQAGFKHSFRYQDLLTISKSPLLFSHGAKFNDQGKIISFAILDAIYGKAFQTVSIHAGDRKITLANTHLLSAYALRGGKYQYARANQAREILHYLKTIVNKDIVLLGDLNFEPETEPYQTIIKLGYIDQSDQIPKTTIKNKKLDYIFTRDTPSNINSVGSKFTKLSDHAFLILELEK